MAPGLQPWKFIIIKNKEKIKEISDTMLAKSKSTGAGGNIILSSSARTISGAKVIIAVYNTSSAVNLVKRFSEAYIDFAKSAELSAISAAIQNIVLEAENLGIGLCWLDAPLFCREDLNRLLKIEGALIAMLALGFPAEQGRRSPRRPLSETVGYIK